MSGLLPAMADSSRFNQFIKPLLQREGGYVNHPADLGGPTNFGITLAILSYARREACTALDVENLTEEEAIEIYYKQYWLDPGFDRLTVSDVIAEMLFDFAVHSGPRQAVRLLQRALGVTTDGRLGPITAGQANSQSGPNLAARVIGERVEFLGRLITRNPTQAAFAHGWMRRMHNFILQIPQA